MLDLSPGCETTNFQSLETFFQSPRMLQDILSSIEGLPMEDLLRIKNHLNHLIAKEDKKSLGKRKYRRAKTRLSGSLEIEREKEFYDQTHKVDIIEMSINSLVLASSTTIIEGDLLQVLFRHPTTGEKKIIDCQAERVQESGEASALVYQTVAKIVGKETIQKYRDMLKKRGQF